MTPEAPDNSIDTPDKAPASSPEISSSVADTADASKSAVRTICFKGPAASPEIVCQRGCIFLNMGAQGLADEGRRKRAEREKK